MEGEWQSLRGRTERARWMPCTLCLMEVDYNTNYESIRAMQGYSAYLREVRHEHHARAVKHP